MKQKPNSELHDHAWEFFREQARDMINEPEGKQYRYRIPRPNMSGDFIVSNTLDGLWRLFIRAWHEPDLNSHSVRGQIQYIVNNF